MYPTIAAFEQDLKPLQSRIPPYSISLHPLLFQHQIMIPNPTKIMNCSKSEADYEDTDRQKSERHGSSCHDEDFVMEDGPQQYQSNGGGGHGIEIGRSGGFGSGNMGIGFISQYPLQIMDGFGMDVPSEIEYQKKGPDNAIESATAAERRHRRMIKNRESAARSRARRQAYTSQLEIEVAELKMENVLLKRRRKVLDDIAAAAPAQTQEVPQKALSAAF